MAPIKKIRPDWQCLSVIQKRNDEIVNVVWDKDSGLRPKEIKTWKLLASYPAIDFDYHVNKEFFSVYQDAARYRIDRVVGEFTSHRYWRTVRTAFFLYTHYAKRAQKEGFEWFIRGKFTDLYIPIDCDNYVYKDKFATEFIDQGVVPEIMYNGEWVNVYEKVWVPVDSL